MFRSSVICERNVAKMNIRLYVFSYVSDLRQEYISSGLLLGHSLSNKLFVHLYFCKQVAE
jgi:hypothetical protein